MTPSLADALASSHIIGAPDIRSTVEGHARDSEKAQSIAVGTACVIPNEDTNSITLSPSAWHEKLCLFVTRAEFERAFRFVWPIPILLWFSYDKSVIGTNFPELCIILYTIIAALIPPLLSSVPIIWFMGLPSVVGGVGCATLFAWIQSWHAENGTSQMLVNLITIICAAFFFALFSNYKIGPYATLFSVPYFGILYSCIYGSIDSIAVASKGIRIHAPPQDLAHIGSYLASLVFPTLPETIIKSLAPILDYFGTLVLAKGLNREFIVPKSIEDIGYANVQSLVGLPIHVEGNSTYGLQVEIPGGSWFPRFMWEGRKELGLVYGCVVYGLIAAGFWTLSQFMPPIRSSTKYYYKGISNLFSLMRNDLNKWGRGIGKVTTVDDRNREIKYLLIGSDDDQALITKKITYSITTSMMLSNLEGLCVLPIGMNYRNSDRDLTLAMRQHTKNTMAARKFLTSMEQIYGSSYLKKQTENLTNWTRDALFNATSLLESCQLAFDMSSTSTNYATRYLLTTHIMVYRTAVNLDRLHLEDIIIGMGQNTSRFENEDLDEFDDPCSIKENQWKVTHYVWLQLFGEAVLKGPLEIADKVLARLKCEEKQSVKYFAGSFSFFISPLPIFFYGLFAPWYKGIKKIFGKSKNNLHSHSDWSYSRYNTWINTGQNLPSAFCGLDNSFGKKLSESNLKSKCMSFIKKFFEPNDAWYCLRLTIGATALFGLALWDKWRTLNLTHESRTGIIDLPGNWVDWDYFTSTKYAPWACLGFITSITPHMTSTIKRGSLRMIGVLCGSLSALLCLLISPRNSYFHAFWIMLFDAIAVYLGAHPSEPYSGFHPSWGYATQLFTYQQTIIIVEARNGHEHWGIELIIARVLGHLIGVGTAIIVSSLIVPALPNKVLRTTIAQALCHFLEFQRASTELAFLTGVNVGSSEEPGAQARSKSSTDTSTDIYLRQWKNHADSSSGLTVATIAKCNDIIRDNEIFLEIKSPFLQTTPQLNKIISCLERLAAYHISYLDFYNALITKKSEDEFFVDERDEVVALRTFEELRSSIGKCLRGFRALINLIIQGLEGNCAKDYFATTAEDLTRAILTNLDDMIGYLPPSREASLLQAIWTQQGHRGKIQDIRSLLWAHAILEAQELRSLASFVYDLLD